MSVSGLSQKHVKQAVGGVLQAAVVGLHHAPEIHYTQLFGRWEGISHGRIASKGQFPLEADCSSYATWCYWNGLSVRGHHSDIINGQHWSAGYTGTMTAHGEYVTQLIPGDAVFYGHPVEHVAIYTGGGFVISHGSEAGPLLLPVRYRDDVNHYRRYI